MRVRELNDDATLDREIRQVLAVDPSPELVALIRRRIALEPAPKRRLSWSACAATALLAGAAVAWFILARVPALPAERVLPLVARAMPEIEAPVGNLVPGDSHPAGPSRVRRRMISQRRARADAPPEILVDPREARAILAFLDGARAGRIEVTPFAAVASEVDPDLKRDISIAPIMIDPLTPVHGPEGVPQ